MSFFSDKRLFTGYAKGQFLYFGENFYTNNLIPMADWPTEFDVISIAPKKLVSLNRLDIGSKVALARHYLGMINDPEAENTYLRIISALTDGTFKEMGNPKKNTAHDYLDSFRKTIIDMQANGFSKSTIPVSKSLNPLDGSHRLATAIALELPAVPIAVLSKMENRYDSDFFFRRGVPLAHLDRMVLNHFSIVPDVSVFVSWPGNSGRDAKRIRAALDSSSTRGVAEIPYEVSFKGLQGVVLNVYRNEPWLGGPSNRYRGARAKSRRVGGLFAGGRKMFFFATEKINEVELKRTLRQELSLGQDSLHSSDSSGEATRLLSLFLNDSSRLLYRMGAPLKYSSLLKRIVSFRDSQDVSKTIVVGSSVLGLLGLRKPNDLDIISLQLPAQALSNTLDEIDNHNQYYAHFYDFKSHDFQRFITNESNYFLFNGIKFLSIVNIKSDLRNWSEFGKKIDLSLIWTLENIAFLTTALRFGGFIHRQVRKVGLATIIFISSFLSQQQKKFVRNYFQKLLPFLFVQGRRKQKGP